MFGTLEKCEKRKKKMANWSLEETDQTILFAMPSLGDLIALIVSYIQYRI